jgi:hypothetical protein
LSATRRGPTRLEIAQRARRAREQTRPEVRAHGGPEAANDIRHFQHDDLCDRSEVVHQLVQRVGEPGANLARQMGVDLDRPGTAVTQGVLDDPQIDAGFQEVRRVRMAERILTLLMNLPQPRFTTATIRSTANT